MGTEPMPYDRDTVRSTTSDEGSVDAGRGEGSSTSGCNGSRSRRSYALGGAASLLVASHTNNSLTGYIFLVAFFCWGSIGLGGPVSASKRGKLLWGCVLAYASLVTAAQAGVHLAFLLAHGSWAFRDPVKQWLALAGFHPGADALQAALSLVPPALVLVAAAFEVKAARRARDDQEEWSEEQEQEQEHPPEQSDTLLAWAAGYTAAGVVVVLALVPAALLRPCLSALPYLAVLLGSVWGWALGGRRSRSSIAALFISQAYIGLHISVLYLWQIEILRASEFSPAAKLLAFFVMRSHNAHLVDQVMILATLHVLYVATGALPSHAGDETDHSHFAMSSWISGISARQEAAGQDGSASEPLLGSPGSEARHEALPKTLDSLVLPCLAGAFMSALEKVCSYQKVAAVALCCYSMVEPSAFSAVTLIVSVWALVSPRGFGKHILVELSPLLAALFVAWLAAAYLATTLSSIVVVPDWLQSVGIYAFDSPPPVFLPLAAQALMVVILSGLARSRLVRGHHSPGGQSAAPVSSEMQRDGSWVAAEEGEQARDQSSFALLGRSWAQFLWHAGFVALPVAYFFVGSSQYDILHAVYLLFLAAYLVWPDLGLAPSARLAIIPHKQHLILRVYASLHLAATYVLLVGHLPGLGHFLEPDAAEAVLQILGLWQPSVRRGILPVLGLLLLMTAHAGLGRWLHQQDAAPTSPWLPADQRREGQGHPSPVLWWARGCVSFGSLLVALLGYILVLFDCPTSLLGLGYLALLASVLLWPPQRRRYQELDHHGRPLSLQASCLPNILRNSPRAADSKHSTLTAAGGGQLRWLPMAGLSAYALLDFLLQFALPAKRLQRIAHVPTGLLNFMDAVAGISPDATGWQLVVRWIRPLVVLGFIHLLRFGFALGCLEAQVAAEEEEVAEEEGEGSLQSQAGFVPLARRCLILHSSKLVALLSFAAVMQDQSAIGWLILGGLAVSGLLLGGPLSQTRWRQRLLQVALISADLLAALWMVTLYAFQVPWLRSKLGSEDSSLIANLEWVGIVSSRPSASLEALLRFKCLILVATALKRRSQRWLGQLPDAVREAGGYGAMCCLFWPPPSAAALERQYTAETWLEWWKFTSFVQSLRLLLREGAANVRKSTRRVLQAVDWPSKKRAEESSRAGQSSLRSLFGSGVQRKSVQQLHILKLAGQEYLENFWQDWGVEVTMAALLAAAFQAVNVLSLVYMLFIALGMALPERLRAGVWRGLVLPALALLLAWQYAVLIGWPPFWPHSPGLLEKHKRHDHPETQVSMAEWLGLSVHCLSALWGLFIAFGISCIQVHHDAWVCSAPRPPRQVRSSSISSNPASAAQAERGEIQPLFDRSADSPGRERLGLTHSGSSESQMNFLWKPMRHSAKKSWSWMDWTRFLFYRHFTDAVLVAVVALCTAENDVIHAAYLAIALLLFRRRDALQSQGNKLFKWLPVYNFMVMLITLAYQAPLPAFLGDKWASRDAQACNLAHVLGLYKIDAGFSLTARGSSADVLLWAIARLQTRVFASTSFAAAMRVAAEEQAVEVAALAEKLESGKRAQVRAAVEHSRLRQARAVRVARLKAGISQSGGSYGVNSALLELQMDAEDRVRIGPDQQLQNTIPGVRPLPQSAYSSPNWSNSQRHVEEDSEQETSEEGTSTTKASDAAPGRGLLDWLARVSQKFQRHDKESYVCYVLFILLFIVDFSFLALLLQILLFCYALLAQPPARLFWQAVLVFTEGVLIAQYVYQIPTRLHCSFATPEMRTEAELCGIHSSWLRSVPIFCVYLATLMHTYQLSRHQEPSSILLRPPGTPRNGVLGGSPSISRRSSMALGAPGAPGTPRRSRPEGAASGQAITRGARHVWRLLCAAFTGTWGFLRRTCSTAERPLHFIRVEFGCPDGGCNELDTVDGREELERSLQGVIEYFRAADLRRSHQPPSTQQDKPPAPDIPSLESEGSQDANVTRGSEPGGIAEAEDSGRKDAWLGEGIDLSTVGPLQLRVQDVNAEAERGVLSVVAEVVAQPSEQSVSSRSIAGWPIRSLKPAKHASQTLQRFHALQGLRDEPLGPPSSSGGNADMERKYSLRAHPVHSDSGAASEAEASSSLTAEPQKGKSQRTAFSIEAGASGRLPSGDLSTFRRASSNTQPARGRAPSGPASEFEGWASELLGRQTSEEQQLDEFPKIAFGLRLENVEWHSRIEQDWYAATVAVDLLAFLYAALFYQAVIKSARTLQDISGDRVVPIDYLAALIVLFFFMVLDRLFYTLGSHLGKAILLVGQMVVVYWYCMRLFWSPRTDSAAKTHLRILLLLKSFAFVCSALQLRSGYPSPASYRGGRGRHAFVFMRQVNMLGSIGYSVFAAIPFLYELRALLDWSCTATTLTLFDWLKLEDIHTSLFLVTVNRKLREQRSLGERQPRYLKFFQGTLLFAGLLILLWVPLLAFSSGNPTYQVPNVLAFETNATLGVTYGNATDKLETLVFPVFSAGQRRSRHNLVSDSRDFPAGVRDSYAATQAKLLCVGQDSDEAWVASAPAQTAMQRMLRAHNATLSIGWRVRRDAPLAGSHGGPECSGVQVATLAHDARSQLIQVLKGERAEAVLASSSFWNGSAAPSPQGSRVLYSYLWQLRGGECMVKPSLSEKDGWPGVGVACNASLAQRKGTLPWWQLTCETVDTEGRPLNRSQGWSECSAKHKGPRLVAVLERVQGGIIGQTLSSFGILGLYITVVLAIGRFLRLATHDMRMRIQYEDLPTTKRLMTLCQDIYIARAEGELALEEELYWALINIYRSPAVMFELTKKKDS